MERIPDHVKRYVEGEPSVKQKLIFEVQKYTGQVNLAHVPINDIRKILKALKKGG